MVLVSTRDIRKRAKEHPECALAVVLSVLTFGLVAIHLSGGDPAELRRTIEAVKPLIDAAAAPSSSPSAPAQPRATPADEGASRSATSGTSLSFSFEIDTASDAWLDPPCEPPSCVEL